MNISEKGEPRIAMSWSDVCLGTGKGCLGGVSIRGLGTVKCDIWRES